jgi:type III restriction enzyme
LNSWDAVSFDFGIDAYIFGLLFRRHLRVFTGPLLEESKRTGVVAVDRLNIIAHDKFQEIVDEASRPYSVIQLKQVVLDGEIFAPKTVTVVAQSQLETRLGIQPTRLTPETQKAGAEEPPAFPQPEEQAVAQLAYAEIRKLERLPGASSLQKPQVQAEILKEVTERYRPSQLVLEGIAPQPDLAAIVAKTAELVMQQTIDIPRILVVPTGEVRSGYKPFTLEVDTLNYQPPSEDLWIQMLRTKQREVLGVGRSTANEARLEDYIVSSLIDFDDISYDDHADLLYDLAEQTVERYRTYLSVEETRKVLQYYRRSIADFIHAQMRAHYEEVTTGLEVKISKGFTALKPSAYTASATEPALNYHVSPADKSNMAKYLFGGFARCLYPVQKFQSDTERKMAVILEREAQKWLKPAKGQFQMFYRLGVDHLEYQPDFVAETDDAIYMLEPKASDEMKDPVVLAKRDVAVLWCQRASDHAATYGGKPWKYLLIPHTAISDNMTLSGLATMFLNG